MASQFAWRDFGKKYKDQNTKYFPGLSRKDKQLEDSLNFKFSSKAQKGFELENKTSVVNQSKTSAELSVKVKPALAPGVQLGLKAKNKPSAEFSVKLTDKLVPLKGANVVVKASAAAPDQQTLNLGGGYANCLVNLNVNLAVPITRKFADFLDESDESNPLLKQRAKFSGDIVGRPSKYPVFLGLNGECNLPKENSSTYYKLEAAVGTQVPGLIAGGYFNSSLQPGKKEGDKDVKASCVGLFGYTEVDDFSVSGNFKYKFNKKTEKYKGVSVEAAASVKRDDNSKLCAKLNIIPQTILSVGYQQKLNDNVDMDFGYAFLLEKGDDKTKSSAVRFGLNLSH